MCNEINDFIEKMIEFFPTTRIKYDETVKKYGKVLETIVIEDIFMPELIKLLKENNNVGLLKKIFEYIEEIVCGGSVQLVNIISVTVFEVLGDDKTVLDNAKKYMGTKTKELQRKADKSLGRMV